jgi:hypothetical protein
MEFKPPANFLNQIHHMNQEIAEAAYQKNNPVIQICHAIKNYVESFEAELDDEHEVGVRLASFGSVLIFHAEKIGFSKPNLITFYGVTEDGERVQLIQHASQLNFLLRAVKRQQNKPRRIGFLWDTKDGNE